jgi:hypothetical protein
MSILILSDLVKGGMNSLEKNATFAAIFTLLY